MGSPYSHPAYRDQPRFRAFSVDGISYRQTAPTRQMASRPDPYYPGKPTLQPRSIAKHPVRNSAKIKNRSNRWERLQLFLIVGGGILAGLFVQILWAGIILTLAYGVAALVFRIRSSITFTLAIIAFAAVIALMATRPDTSLTNNFAAYAFLLLTIGVITLNFEVRPQKRRARPRGR